MLSLGKSATDRSLGSGIVAHIYIACQANIVGKRCSGVSDRRGYSNRRKEL